MPVSIQFKPVKTKSKAKAIKAHANKKASVERVKLENLAPEFVDQFVYKLRDLEKKQEKLKTLEVSVEKDKASLREAADVISASAEGLALGEEFQIVLGQKGNQTEITDLEGIRKKLGHEVFMQIAKVNLKDLELYLSGNEIAAFTKQERVRARTIKIFDGQDEV